ncbi:MAG: PEP-CTERM sorting domain-containing protein [Phycisphaerales bacterium]|nr:PEP-CTERM sorting domain-containing protein [Phycisphaerales bacterium]
MIRLEIDKSHLAHGHHLFFTGICLSICVAGQAAASFVSVGQSNLGVDTANGIACSDTNFYTTGRISGDSSTHYIDVHDSGYSHVGTIDFPATSFGGFALALRGAAYDEATNTLLVVEFDTNNQILREVGLDGALINSIDPAHGAFLNGVAVSPDDGSLWFAYWDGTVEHFDRSGTFLGGFAAAGRQWTSIDIDPVSGTLLLLDGSANNDALYEYDTSGVYVGAPILIDMIANEGFGICYDETTATLHAIGSPGLFGDPPAVVSVFQDPSRPVVPEPASLAMLGLGAMLVRRRRA